jgi:serine/threonine protein kinase
MPTAQDIPASSPSGLWRRTKAIVGDALELPNGDRAAFVEQSCQGDDSLRSEVLALLRSYETAGDAFNDAGVPALTLSEALAAVPVAEGAMVGRYRIGANIGTGGMGAVFEAFDTALQRPVAIKLLSVGLSSAAARRRFEAEASTLARLDHPNVARVYEAGVQQAPGQPLSLPFFAMELVDGARTLDAYVRATNPDLRTLLALFATICDAVHHGHQKGVLHRDIKPANILIDKQGVPKVIDFGVARLADANQQASHARTNTQAGDLVGTPAYLPPEAFEQGMHAVDIRADVYALGITLYELLARAPAFGQAHMTPATARSIIRGKPPKLLGTIRADCKGDVETVVAKAIAHETADRYQSVEQFAADLRHILAYEPVLARRASLARQTTLFAKRNKLLVSVALTVAVALAVGAGGLAVGLSKARASERRALEEATRARQVSDFLTQMVRSADPFPGLGRTPLEELDTSSNWPTSARPGSAPSVGDLLHTASGQIESSFPNDPELQAEVALLIARSASGVADQRSGSMAVRAHVATERAFGLTDPRSLQALSLAMNEEFNSSNYRLVPKGMLALDYLNATDDPANDPMAESFLESLCTAALSKSNAAQARTLLAARREAIKDRTNIKPVAFLLHDLMDARILGAEKGPRAALERFPALLATAESITDTRDDPLNGVLFEMQRQQRAAGDFFGALQTLGEGTARSTRQWGGLDPSTYEWWGGMYFVAMQLGDYETAEWAARQQLFGASSMLGPTSQYTTKAQGRVARVLLAQGKNLPEAAALAKAAYEGTPELLAIFDGWAVYHELLYAWTVRLLGDPARAQRIIEDRYHASLYANIERNISWVELIRHSELSQCRMEVAEAAGVLSPEAAHAIEFDVQEAECFARDMGPTWPASRLATLARARWNAMRER